MPINLTIVPSIDLRNGKVVRLQQGDFSRQIDYELHPLELAKSFADSGATVMHVVDLDGAKAGKVVQLDLVADIARHAGITLQAGGGVRSTDDVVRLLEAGVSRVVVGTQAFADWNWFESLWAHPAVTPGKLVLAVDAIDGVVATHAWTQQSDVGVLSIARRVSGSRLAGLLYTDVSKDGMLQGPNVERTAELAASTDVPVIASGGVGSLTHIDTLRHRGIWGVILGRSLHDGRIQLTDAIRVARDGLGST